MVSPISLSKRLLQRSVLLLLVAAGLLFILAPKSEAAILFWRGTANTVAVDRTRWEDKNNWSSHPRGSANVAAAPGASDTAVFNFSGTSLQLRSIVTIGGLVMTNAWTGSILQGTGTLNIGTSGLRMGSGTFVGGVSGVINNTGSFTMTGGVVRSLQGIMNMSGNLAINSVSASRPQFTLTGTLVMSGNASQTYNIGQNRVTAVVNNLTIRNSGAAGSNLVRSTGSGMSFSGAVTVNLGVLDLTQTSQAQNLIAKGGMTIASATTAGFQSANNVTLSGSLIARATSVWSHTGGTFTFNGDNPQRIVLYGGGRRFNNLTINNSGNAGTQNRVYMSGANLFASGALTVTAGTLDLMTNSQTLSAKGGITLANAAAAVLKTNQNITMSGSLTLGAASLFTQTGGTLNFNADNPQTATINTSNQRFNNITINNSATTIARNKVIFAGNTFSLSGSVTVTVGSWDGTTNSISTAVAGNVTVADSALARFITAGNLTLSGNIIVKPAATFTQSAGTTYPDGTSQTLSGSMTLFNLEKLVGGTTLLFYPSATYTYTISNSLNTQGGGTSNKLIMKSAIAGSRWRISPTVRQTITYVALTDSSNVGILNETCLDCTNGGNNQDWTFEVTPTVNSTASSGSSGGGGGRGRSNSASSPSTVVTPAAVSAPAAAVKSATAALQQNKALQRRADLLQKRIDSTKKPALKKALQKVLDRLNKSITKMKK